MAFLRIYCGLCNRKWEVYERAMNDERSRQCPHCLAEIDSQTWRGQIVPALAQTSDANRELMKDTGYAGVSLFSFDVIGDHNIKGVRR